MPKPPASSLLSGLLVTPTTTRQLSTPDILSLVLRLSSGRIPPGAKKSGLMQLLQVPSVTESLVHQLLTMESGDLLCGVKCVLANYLDTESEDTAEVVELTLTFLNKCLALQKSSPRLRSLVVGKSRELAVSFGGLSALEKMVVVSRARGNNTAMVDQVVCEEITQELRLLPAGKLLGCCYTAGDLQGEVASWVRMELEMDTGATQSTFVRSIEEKYRVVELFLLREDMTEVSLSGALLSKYSRSFWPAVHTVRQASQLGGQVGQDSPCVCLTVVRFSPTGHVLAYTDMDWQARLDQLDQELQVCQAVSHKAGDRDLQPGHMVMAHRAAMKLSTTPLYQFNQARAIVLSLSPDDTVELYLMDHGIQASIPSNMVSSLSPSLKTLSPRLVLCRVQGITPTPSTKLLTQSITSLSHLTNSATASSLLMKPSLSTPKMLCQLLSSQQTSLVSPALDILLVLSSTQASCKYLVNSGPNIPCMAVELIIPSLLSLLSSSPASLPLRPVCTALETLHCLLVTLKPQQVRMVFSDGRLCSTLEKVQEEHTLGQYQAVLDKILDMDQGKKSKVFRQEQCNQGDKAKLETKTNVVFKNTDIRERQPQQIYNPHRVVTTDRPVFASADQLHRQGLGRGGHTQTREQVVPVIHPDTERRKQERKELTAAAMKLFQQHRSVLPGSGEAAGDGNIIGTETGRENTAGDGCDDSIDSTGDRELKVGKDNVSATANISAPQVKADSPSSTLLPSWLGGDDSSSSSEEESDSGLPPWLAKTAPPTQPVQAEMVTRPVPDHAVTRPLPDQAVTRPVPDHAVTRPLPEPVSQLTHSVALLPFSSALGSSTSSSQEDQNIATSTKLKNILPTHSPHQADTRQVSHSPEEFGSGTESGREVQTVREQQLLVRDYILSEKHSIGVELWDTERKQDLNNNQLAVLICGFLNTQAGGTIYAGVKRNGLVRGIPLERKDRDTMRQMLDRVLASMINPRVPPNIVDIDFVSVEDKSRPSCPYRLLVVMVKGQSEGLDKVYMAHNLTTRSQVEEGAYVRRGTGPVFNIKLGHQEMLRLVERR
eukprot:GFUD01041097.1.p1 GENE.GFUD01041097.1~~GFUD01041097.1.p1  ORF type:complete len:1056 (+),score=428.40 GFUD01041097.1:696-3863(+)